MKFLLACWGSAYDQHPYWAGWMSALRAGSHWAQTPQEAKPADKCVCDVYLWRRKDWRIEVKPWSER